MEDQDKIIEVLERIKSTIIEVQAKFSEAADIFSRGKAYDLSQFPGGKEIVNYVNQKERTNRDMQNIGESLSEYDELIWEGECLKNFITGAQARFLNATRIMNHKYSSDLNEEQIKDAQREINQATLEIVSYNELLRRLYQALGIKRDF